MDLKQLLTVGTSSEPSSSQLWFHIMNLGVLCVYLFIGIKVGFLISASVATAPALIDSVVWFTLVVSGIITGNKFANVLINLKSGQKVDGTDTKVSIR